MDDPTSLILLLFGALVAVGVMVGLLTRVAWLVITAPFRFAWFVVSYPFRRV